MYDFWYCMGVAIANPGLLTAVMKATPKFIRVKQTITNVDGTTGAITVLNGGKPLTFAGILDQDATNSVRDAIRAAIAGTAGAPPVSIATAARFCQYAVLTDIQFDKVLGWARNAFQSAFGDYHGTPPATFPALIGVTLVDGKVVTLINAAPADAPPTDPLLRNFLDEFGLSQDPKDPIRSRLVTFVKHPYFSNATDSLLNNPKTSPWQMCGGEHFFFWPAKDEYAIH
jgi:hypothetical protein